MSEFKNRLIKNWKHRKKWAKKQNIEAYRLYHWDIPSSPFIVDAYKDSLILWELTHPQKDSDPQEKIENAQKDLETFHEGEFKNIILKSRRSKETYTKLQNQQKFKIIREHTRLYQVNLYDYLDTGLFLDHRPLRNWFQEKLQGKIFLNLFSYTSSFGVAAALSGKETVNVDLSNTYSKWAQKNYEINNIPTKGHQFYSQDVFKFLSQSREKFDTIFCDPPTFSNSKKTTTIWDIQRDHPALIELCLERLAPKGRLYFSGNKKSFSLELKEGPSLKVKNITSQTIPADFPQNIHFKTLVTSILGSF